MNCRSMHLVVILSIFLSFCESASVYKEDSTLKLIHNDVSKINNAVEEISFEILKKILEDPMESEEMTTLPPESEHLRRVRSVEDDIKGLCRRQCIKETQQNQTLEAKQIKELKLEVQKLQDLVKVLQEQQKIINDLDEKQENSTHYKETRSEKELEEPPKPQIEENIPNSEQLSIMKANLKNVIQSLNQTKEFINLQNQKDKILEDELIKQKQELDALKTAVTSIINQSTSEARSRDAESSPRSSEDASELKKLLSKVLPDEDNSSDDSSISHAKILAFAEALKKLKKEDNVKKEKANDNSNLMKLLLSELKKPSQSKSDDIDVGKLKNLQDEISKTSKESINFAQFQAILDKLATAQNPANPSPQMSLTAQQMAELTKKIVSFGGGHNMGENYILNPVPSSASHPNLTPYICVVDNGYGFPAIPRNSYQNGPPIPPPVPQRAYNPPPPTPPFFPGPYPTPNNYNQGNAYQAAPDKQYSYPGENPGTVQKYQDDLKLQINGLQTAIDSLNRPEYSQEPGDRETVNNLEKQINDLKQVVDGLNYDPNYQSGRSKRSMENNQVSDSSDNLKPKNVQEKKSKTEENPIEKIELIQNRINKLRSQLNQKITDDTFSNFRAAEESNNNNNYATAYNLPFNLFSELESSDSKLKTAKNDVFVELIGNILDKVLAAIPMILHKLFNFSLSQFTQYGYQDYDLQTVFKNMGVFGILPVILIRMIEGFSTFLKVLKKNSFFKNFIIPAIILGVIAGGVLFLIWWLQPDDYDSYYHQYGNDYSVDGYAGGSTYTQNYGAQYQPSTSPSQTYSKNYYSPSYNK